MAIDIENFPNSEAAQRMLTYITAHWYDNSYVGKWVFEVMGREIDDVKEIIDALPDEMIYNTATWALKYHEIKHGLTIREDLTSEERRARISEKIGANKVPMSPYWMEKKLSDFTGYTVHVYDIHDKGTETITNPNIFFVRFEGDSEISMLDALKKIRALKQSHTLFGYAMLLMTILNEEAFVPRITYRMTFAWWDKYMDGSYLMNGAINMDMEYPDIFDRLRIRTEVENVNDVGVNWLVPIYLDGTEEMNGRIKMYCGREVL